MDLTLRESFAFARWIFNRPVQKRHDHFGASCPAAAAFRGSPLLRCESVSPFKRLSKMPAHHRRCGISCDGASAQPERTYTHAGQNQRPRRSAQPAVFANTRLADSEPVANHAILASSRWTALSHSSSTASFSPSAKTLKPIINPSERYDVRRDRDVELSTGLRLLALCYGGEPFPNRCQLADAAFVRFVGLMGSGVTRSFGEVPIFFGGPFHKPGAPQRNGRRGWAACALSLVRPARGAVGMLGGRTCARVAMRLQDRSMAKPKHPPASR